MALKALDQRLAGGTPPPGAQRSTTSPGGTSRPQSAETSAPSPGGADANKGGEPEGKGSDSA